MYKRCLIPILFCNELRVKKKHYFCMLILIVTVG